MIGAPNAQAATPAPTLGQPTSFTVTSFDGTKITGYYFKTGTSQHPAPTILKGPGWGGEALTDPAPTSPSDLAFGNVGVSTLLRSGYNVITWNPRGFHTSGGRAEVDDAYHEGRDVSAVLDWLTHQPEAQLDGKTDPRVGMVGGSYGGTVQLAAAALDHRIDAIAPDVAWNSPVTALYTNSTARSGWLALLAAGAQAAGQRNDPRIDKVLADAQSSFTLPADDVHFLASRGPNYLLDQIRTPTLLLQGTADTVFPLREAVANYQTLTAAHVPIKMVWFCGGHGLCLANPGDTSRIQDATLSWLARYVKKAPVSTGQGFAWVDQTGMWHTAPTYTAGVLGEVTAKGSGDLTLGPTGGSGPYTGPIPAGGQAPYALVTPTPAPNAVNLPIRFSEPTRIVGAPQLTLTYRGNSTRNDARVLAQLVDDNTHLVLGNQITPIPVVLDGQSHTLSVPLEDLAARAQRGSTFTLQILAQSSIFNTHPDGSNVSFNQIKIEMPTLRQ